MKRFLSTVVLALVAAAFAVPAQANINNIGADYKPVGDGQFVKDLTSANVAKVYVVGAAISNGLIDFDRGSAFVGTLYACNVQDADADNSGAVDASAGCTALATLSSSLSSVTFTTGKRFFVLDIDTAESGSNVSRLTIRGSNVAGGGFDATALAGTYMTPATLTYMSTMKHFEGLDSKIPWTRYWIDPYSGSDSNDGSYAEPFKTIGKWKTLAGFGTWFTIKNGGRDRPMYISNQTYDYPTTETCVVGETITYDAGGSTSKILDIDLKAGVFVVETLTGSALTAADVITAGSQSGAGCAWTVGTRRPSIWDGTAALCALDNFDTCNVADRFKVTGCTGGGSNICSAASAVEINLSATPTSYDGRIVSIIDAEDPDNPPIIHGDKETVGDSNNTEIGVTNPAYDTANDLARDPGGLFITGDNGTTTSYGCLGVANIWADAVMDDIISQHSEGCVRALNVRADRVWNLSNAKNNNVVTTHGGTAGRGGVVSINGSGIGYRYDDTGGPPIAPTGSAHMILLGTGAYAADMTNWGGATLSSVMTATGGSISVVGHEVYCDGTGGATLGCTGLSAVAQDSAVSLDLIRVLARFAKNSAAAAVGLTSNGYAINAKIYRGSFDGGRAIQTNAANGAITLDVKGGIFSGLDYYVYDLSTYAGASTTTTGTVNGVYDNDGSNRWATDAGATTFNTAALAEAGMETWDIMTGTYSVQTDATEYTSDFGLRCASTGECWDAYSEVFSVEFPEVIYDYLPVPIRGYTESGTRNYGAR